jgi:hypothetical protein
VKSFVWLYHFEGRPRRLTFGTYPSLSLADAGVKLAEAQSLLAKGIDPGSRIIAGKPNGTQTCRRSRCYLDRYARVRWRNALRRQAHSFGSYAQRSLKQGYFAEFLTNESSTAVRRPAN